MNAEVLLPEEDFRTLETSVVGTRLKTVHLLTIKSFSLFYKK
jgi:hypothetical protein